MFWARRRSRGLERRCFLGYPYKRKRSKSLQPKKKLKTLVTFSNETVFDRALAEPNTSALIEVLLAQHFGIELPETGSIQSQTRQVVLSQIAPLKPMAATPESVPTGTLLKSVPTGTLTIQLNPEVAPAAPTEPVDPLADEDGLLDEQDGPEAPPVPESPAAPSLPEVPTPPATPPESPAAPFAPILPPNHPAVPVTPTAAYTAGDKVCPTCGNNFAPLPYCLNCL